MVTVKFICVIAGARAIKLRSCIILSFLNGRQSFATACQLEMSERPRQAEPGSGISKVGSRAMQCFAALARRESLLTCPEQGEGSHRMGTEGFL